MKVIGLTGSVAMGKSEAARYLASLGFPVFDADREVHKLYDSAEGAALLWPCAPEAVKDGKVDRQRLSALVLRDPALLKKVETLVHAEIRNRRNDFVAESKAAGAKAVILDIPLLFETGAEKDVDTTIVVSSSLENQRARALARPGMTEEKLQMILARQMPDGQKRAKADHVIENDGSLADLEKGLAALLKEMRLTK